MSKLKPTIKRIVNRAVEEASIRAEIAELKRQRRVAAETLDFYTRYYAGEFNEEPDVAPDDDADDDYASDAGYIPEEDGDDDWYEDTED